MYSIIACSCYFGIRKTSQRWDSELQQHNNRVAELVDAMAVQRAFRFWRQLAASKRPLPLSLLYTFY
ncbi:MULTISPECIES: hypothetical protein [unclassified Paenibacillus]|uniref:hypothetical protein n=1 Tax=unclassified Paenibacillus TaxID=185978 RepID=UPI002F41DCD3